MTTEVDGMFWKWLVERLEQVKDFEAFASSEEENKAEAEAQRNEIRAQIDACERAMKRLSKRLVQLSIINEEGDYSIHSPHVSTR